jgi:hypothetical protein
MSRGAFANRCYVCGDPTAAVYCRAHEDLSCGPLMPPQPPPGADRLTDLHSWWLETQTPEQIVDLAGCLA